MPKKSKSSKLKAAAAAKAKAKARAEAAAANVEAASLSITTAQSLAAENPTPIVMQLKPAVASTMDSSPTSLLAELTALSPELYKLLLRNTAKELIEEAAVGHCYAVHRLNKTDDKWTEYATLFDPNNMPRKKRKSSIFHCRNCQSKLAATIYASHLEKCLSRANRRASSSSSGSGSSGGRSRGSTSTTGLHIDIPALSSGAIGGSQRVSGRRRTPVVAPQKAPKVAVPVQVVSVPVPVSYVSVPVMAVTNNGLTSQTQQMMQQQVRLQQLQQQQQQQYHSQQYQQHQPLQQQQYQQQQYQQQDMKAADFFVDFSAPPQQPLYKQQQAFVGSKRKHSDLTADPMPALEPKDLLWCTPLPPVLPTHSTHGGYPYLYVDPQCSEVQRATAPTEKQLEAMLIKICGCLTSEHSRKMCVNKPSCKQHSAAMRKRVRESMNERSMFVRFKRLKPTAKRRK
jgi:hypothetical protein